MKKIVCKTIFRATLFKIFIAIPLFAIAGYSQTKPFAPKLVQFSIDNFGQLDDRFYRGSQPNNADLAELKSMGINTIINLRDNPSDAERKEAERLGLAYISIPMSPIAYPNDADIEKFLAVAADSATGKFFVHCLRGEHRTGVIGAVYRIRNYGWDFDRSYEEMKNYGYYSMVIYRNFRKYAKEFAEREKRKSS